MLKIKVKNSNAILKTFLASFDTKDFASNIKHYIFTS